MLTYSNPSLGAIILPDNRVQFTVWAPKLEAISVVLIGHEERERPLQPIGDGYFQLVTAEARPGDRYTYRLGTGQDRPDPASRYQPEGVHGSSQIIDPRFDWDDTNWKNPQLRDHVLYELHVGTFTDAGTFEAIIPHLERLRSLGITGLSLMPVAQFPGSRNWGYDGVQPYAVQHSYGGPQGLKKLVNACHQHGLAVMLDVVYNHFGPEGNYLHGYGPYFTDRYRGHWGDSLNFDGPHSDHVRRYFIENAIYWMQDFHIDGFRLDATHALYDFSAIPFLEELGAAIHAWADSHNRRVHVIAENDQGNAKLTQPRSSNGLGIDAQWLDDLHHVVHVHLTGESDGYYVDYTRFAHVEKALREGFVYSGEYSPARQRRQGTSSRHIPGDRFVVSTQTHDQVGNRLLGDRLTALTDFDGLKLAAGVVLWSIYVPMLFMGEEYAETAPFQYFISHGDPNLIEAVRNGRAEEFAAFGWEDDAPDPQSEAVFNQCKLNHDLRKSGHHQIMYAFYGALLRLRRELPALRNPDKHALDIWVDRQQQVICMTRWVDSPQTEMVCVAYNMNLTDNANIILPLTAGYWTKQFNSAEEQWQPPGARTNASPLAAFDTADPKELHLAPKSFALFVKQ